jgi:peroxiredoxin
MTKSDTLRRDQKVVIPAGTPAPDFALKATPDRVIRLSELRGRPVILVFYPADWSPVCGDQVALYNEILPEFREYGAELLGISVDGVWCHAAFATDRKLHFPLLSDFEPKGAVSRLYGAYREEDGFGAEFPADRAPAFDTLSDTLIYYDYNAAQLMVAHADNAWEPEPWGSVRPRQTFITVPGQDHVLQRNDQSLRALIPDRTGDWVLQSDDRGLHLLDAATTGGENPDDGPRRWCWASTRTLKCMWLLR